MRKSRVEMKAELMRAAERTIDELLNWNEAAEQPNLSQIERVVLDLRKELSEQMSETVIASQEAVRPVPGPACAGCQQEMSYKGMHPKTVTSWIGDLTLERAYYYCDQCKGGLFPPG